MLDQIIQRLQNMSPFNIWAIKPDGTLEPWYSVTGPGIIPELVIRDQDIETQLKVVSAQVSHWGRMAAQAQRILEIEERHYRVWRSAFYLKIRKEKDEKGKALYTEKEFEALYRTDPEYGEFQARIERAREALNSATAICDVFKAKQFMLRPAEKRNRE